MELEDEINVADVLATANMDWTPLGESFVKRYTNYEDLKWDVDLSKHKVVIAPYGGPVAVLFKSQGGIVINIYSLTGHRISYIKFEGGKIVGMGWTASEQLITIFDDGTMDVHSVQGEKIFNRLLTREVRDSRVLECKFFHTMMGYSGFAVMTYEYQFFVVSDSDRDKDDIRVKAMANLPSSTRPTCWAVLPQGNSVGVLAAVEDKLYHILPFESVPITISCKKTSPQWSSIAISLNGKAAAMIDKEGYIWAGSSDFKTSETEFDTQSTAQVHQMEWAANDFIVLLFDKFMFLKGLGKHWCKLPVRTTSVLQPEIDGVRILTSFYCEFLHKVSTSTLSVLKVASLQPGAILNDAYKEYKGDESHKADEFIRYIKDQLPDAVKQCIQAASEEYHPSIQQALLMSANFGKGFLGPDVSHDVIRLFVETCRYLRVLNTVRLKNVGIPITYRQFSRLSPGVLNDRLINREIFPLALEVCNYLNIPPALGKTKVLRQWAQRKVQDKSISETDIANMILKKFKDSGVVISFTEIARVARKEGRKTLASQLLEHESLVSDQVQMLLEMKDTDKALDKAIGSWDSQLVYEVLEEIKGTEDTARYMQIFHHRPVAAALYKKYCKECDPDGLVNLCRQESDFLEAGINLLSQSYNKERDSKGKLVPQQEKLKLAHKEFIDGQLQFHLKVVEDQDRLLREQEDLKQKLGVDLIGCTLFNTLLELVRKNELKIAENMKKKFAMSDSLFWWAKLRGLADVANFEELERFSKQKKSPIGYEPFARICIEKSRYREAVKYIPRCSPENKCNLYMLTGDWQKAAEAAFNEKDVGSLNEILSRQGRNPELADLVKQMKARLGAT